jgi:hypothetical protein
MHLRLSSAIVLARQAATSSLGVLAWALLTGLAVFGLSLHVMRQDYDVVSAAVVCFAAAFVVAGMITGLIASVTAGQKRWAARFFLIGIAIVGASDGWSSG